MNEFTFIKHLQALYEPRGPYTSLYLNTETRAEQGSDELSLRWRALREKARGEGAEEALLSTIDSIVDGSHRHGDGLVMLAAEKEVRFRRYLRTRVEDSVSFGSLPHLLPLIEWGQDNPPHIVMLQDRVGADVYVVQPDRETEHETIEGDKPDIGRTSRGGWAQPRFQRGATKAWRDNATLVAKELGKIADREDIEIVLIAGDTEALHLLKENLPEQPGYLFEEIDGSRQLRIEELEEELHKAVASYVGQTIEQLLERFVEERGQEDLATEGVGGTLAALRNAQVDTLLIRSGGVEGTAFCSAENPNQAARDRNELEGLGLDDVVEAEATDVLIGGAISSGAKVKVIPDLSEVHGPREGVGAILRYA